MVVSLLKHFGKDNPFTDGDAFRYLFPDVPEKSRLPQWAYGPRAWARQNARQLPGKPYLISYRAGGESLLEFTNDVKKMREYRRWRSGAHYGDLLSMLELTALIVEQDPEDEINSFWLDAYAFSEKAQRKAKQLEERADELAELESKLQLS